MASWLPTQKQTRVPESNNATASKESTSNKQKEVEIVSNKITCIRHGLASGQSQIKSRLCAKKRQDDRLVISLLSNSEGYFRGHDLRVVAPHHLNENIESPHLSVLLCWGIRVSGMNRWLR
jgi:hypothetical protein